jgi:NADPH-dependent curcumin reductase CurA
MKNRQIVLTEIPKGHLEESHFTLKEGESPVPGEGEILVRTKLISLDAANRAWMQGATYRDAVKAGDIMQAYVIGEVVESNSDKVQKGDLVQGEGCWADFFTTKGTRVLKLSGYEPTSYLMSVLGIAGKTAYYGLLNVGQPKTGETVLVSAAAGSVGIYVGQIAKIKGCRAVGIAGGPEKCQWLVDELGFDAAVDYKAPSFVKDLKEACPDGVDVYFDNVGGKILELVLFMMNMRGRVVCCGAVSQYDTGSPSGPRNVPGMLVVKRLRMEGFIASDYPEQEAQATADLRGWVESGKIKVVEDIVDGLENAPRALIGLLHGENRGKRMVRVTGD